MLKLSLGTFFYCLLPMVTVQYKGQSMFSFCTELGKEVSMAFPAKETSYLTFFLDRIFIGQIVICFGSDIWWPHFIFCRWVENGEVFIKNLVISYGTSLHMCPFTIGEPSGHVYVHMCAWPNSTVILNHKTEKNVIFLVFWVCKSLSGLRKIIFLRFSF